MGGRGARSVSIIGRWQEADGTILEFVKVGAADGGWYYEACLVEVSDKLKSYGFQPAQSKELTLVAVAPNVWVGVGIIRDAQGPISGYQFRRPACADPVSLNRSGLGGEGDRNDDQDQ